jgi:penicillin-binding protein-related factor A (putative recombinase)
MTTLQQDLSAEWESLIKRECKDLAKAKLAFVSKNHEAPRIPGKKRPRSKSKPDFSGHSPAGRHIVFEAKSSLCETRFDFGLITDGQYRILKQAHQSGCISFIYFIDGARRRWVIPWRAVQETEIERFSLPLIEPNLVYQKRPGETWLATWKRLAEAGHV